MESNHELIAAAENVAGILQARDIPFVVIGALALAAHHYVRFTRDLDLGVNADLPAMRGLLKALTAGGFEGELLEPDGDDPLAGVIDIHGAFGLIQIVSFADRFPAAITDALRANPPSLYPGSLLKAVPLPQLVALKLYAGGSKSRLDILELLRSNPDCDREALLKTCQGYHLRGLAQIFEELASEEGQDG